MNPVGYVPNWVEPADAFDENGIYCHYIEWYISTSILSIYIYIYSQKMNGLWEHSCHKSLSCIYIYNMITLQMHLDKFNFWTPFKFNQCIPFVALMQIISNKQHYQILLKWVQIDMPHWFHISWFNFNKIWLFSHITKCHQNVAHYSWNSIILYYKTFREWQHPRQA